MAAPLLDRYPAPTSTGTANNYTRVDNEGDTQDQFDGRVDHRFSDSGQFIGRYSFAHDHVTPVTPLSDGSGSVASGAIANSVTTGHSVAVSYLHSFSTTLANEVRFGYTRRSIDRAGLLLDAPPSEALKILGIPSNGDFSNELPTFATSGFQQLGPSANTDSKFRTGITELIYQLFKRSGRHSLKTGLDFRWERLDIVQPPCPGKAGA